VPVVDIQLRFHRPAGTQRRPSCQKPDGFAYWALTSHKRACLVRNRAVIGMQVTQALYYSAISGQEALLTAIPLLQKEKAMSKPKVKKELDKLEKIISDLRCLQDFSPGPAKDNPNYHKRTKCPHCKALETIARIRAESASGE
jgi:hypothetical protein